MREVESGLAGPRGGPPHAFSDANCNQPERKEAPTRGMNPWLQLGTGLFLLTVGARTMIHGSGALALRLGLTPLVIGLTVLAYGTSAPELVVSAEAAWQQRGGIALGNVIGSNVCNIALILGLCALLRPIPSNGKILTREVPVLIGVSGLTLLLLLDRELGRIDGVILLSVLAGYTWFVVRDARREAGAVPAADAPRPHSLVPALMFTLGGLALLLVGADLLVEGAVQFSRAWGWSELLIGITVIAVGTSLPELALSFAATIRNEADVALGNVVGSCIFNLLGILGIAGVVRPVSVPELHRADLAVMAVTALALVPLLRGNRRITRLDGALLLLGYTAYAVWMLQRAEF